jgi:hypothetical protein
VTGAVTIQLGSTTNGVSAFVGPELTLNRQKSSIATELNMTASRIHPGILLRTEFFEPLNITQLAASKGMGIP